MVALCLLGFSFGARTSTADASKVAPTVVPAITTTPATSTTAVSSDTLFFSLGTTAAKTASTAPVTTTSIAAS
jgi:hypothetical protein